ncbi:MAG: Spy/CpxP family protein refolding chaperone [Stellaceae bacterium]
MNIIGSRYLASAAVAALLALPMAAFAQSAAPTAPEPATAPPAAATTAPSSPAAGASAEQRVEAHIKELRTELRITAAEQPQWEQFAQVMRQNARDMDQAFMQRAQQYPSMNAVQNMQSYEKIADAHVQHLQKLVPAFQNLYNAMPEQQQHVADQVFRANAQQHQQKRMQTGHNG